MKNFKLMFVVIIGVAISACSPVNNEPCEDAEECPTCEVCEACPICEVCEVGEACPICEVCKVCEVCEVCPTSPFPEGLVLPQIHIQGKLFWTSSDLESLNDNVIGPIVEYFEADGFTVVSITVSTDDLLTATINTIIVEVVVSDNDGNQNPLHMGVLIEKVDGVFPVWEQESMGP